MIAKSALGKGGGDPFRHLGVAVKTIAKSTLGRTKWDLTKWHLWAIIRGPRHRLFLVLGTGILGALFCNFLSLIGITLAPVGLMVGIGGPCRIKLGSFCAELA